MNDSARHTMQRAHRPTEHRARPPLAGPWAARNNCFAAIVTVDQSEAAFDAVLRDVALLKPRCTWNLEVADVMERGNEVVGLLYPYEEVDIFVVTSRLAQEEVDCPAPSEPEIDTFRRRDVTDFGDGDKLRVSASDDPTPLTRSI